jgi:hypothetical protein
MSSSYRPILDFLTLPDVFVGEIELRRNDLADLRLHVRHPEGIESGRCLSKQSRNRLIVHGMLGLGEDLDGNVRTFATDYGIAVARANSSCIDGSEGLSTTPGHREVGKDLTEGARRVAGRITRGGLLIPPPSTLPSIDTHFADFDRKIPAMPPHVRTTMIYYWPPNVPDYQDMLGGAMSDAFDPPVSEPDSLAAAPAAHGRLRLVGAAVWSWLRRWRCYARGATMTGVGPQGLPHRVPSAARHQSSRQSMGSTPFAARNALTFEKGREPMKPR